MEQAPPPGVVEEPATPEKEMPETNEEAVNDMENSKNADNSDNTDNAENAENPDAKDEGKQPNDGKRY